MDHIIKKSGSTTRIYSTEEGRLYIKPKEFFKQPKIVSELKEWSNSEVVTNLEQRKVQGKKNTK